MDIPLKNILKDIQKEYDLDDEVIEPIIKKLNKEFYFKLKDIKNLSEETWTKFDLPLNLYYILNELYQTSLNENSQKEKIKSENPNINIEQKKYQQQINQKQQFQPYQSNEFQKEIKTNISLEKEEFDSEIIHMHLAQIFTDIDNIDISRDVFQFIYQIISNISQNPSDEKYRRINIKKILNKYNYPSIKIFLNYLHFKEVDEYMYLIGNANFLNEIIPELNSFIAINKLVEINFNPYQASIASIGNNEKLKEVTLKEVNFEDLYYEELKRRNNIINNSKVNRNPKAYEITSEYSLNSIIAKMNEIDNFDMISNSEDDKLIYKKAMDIIKENQNNRFTLKSRLNYEKLINTPIYVKSDIRFKFPDSNILEASFSLNEKIEDLYNFIKEYLNNPNDKFTISTTPPPKRYIKINETIQFNKLFPQVLMYVNFDDQYNGLNSDKINKIKITMNFD